MNRRWKEFIDCLRLARYGYRFGTNSLLSLFFWIAIFVFQSILNGASLVVGMWCAMPGMFFVQTIVSCDIPTMVQTSPYKKAIQVRIPVYVLTASTLILYTIDVIYKHFCFVNYSHARSGIAESFILAYVVFVVVAFVYPAAYKSIEFGIGIIGITSVSVFGILSVYHKYETDFISLGINKMIIIGYVIIVLSGICQRIIAERMYKKEFFKNIFKGSAGTY